MNEHGLRWEHVVNIDETSVHLLPSRDRAWYFRGANEKAAFCTDKACITATLACFPLGGPIINQLIFTGKTPQVLPRGPHNEHQSVTHSENHWATQSSLLAFLQQIQDHIWRTQQTQHVHWLCVLDCAPQHVAAAFAAADREQLPFADLVYVQRKTTSFNQPLDISYTRSFKASLRNASSTSFARG